MPIPLISYIGGGSGLLLGVVAALRGGANSPKLIMQTLGLPVLVGAGMGLGGFLSSLLPNSPLGAFAGAQLMALVAGIGIVALLQRKASSSGPTSPWAKFLPQLLIVLAVMLLGAASLAITHASVSAEATATSFAFAAISSALPFTLWRTFGLLMALPPVPPPAAPVVDTWSYNQAYTFENFAIVAPTMGPFVTLQLKLRPDDPNVYPLRTRCNPALSLRDNLQAIFFSHNGHMESIGRTLEMVAWGDLQSGSISKPYTWGAYVPLPPGALPDTPINYLRFGETMAVQGLGEGSLFVVARLGASGHLEM